MNHRQGDEMQDASLLSQGFCPFNGCSTTLVGLKEAANAFQ